jgi:hypothetical protein
LIQHRAEKRVFKRKDVAKKPLAAQGAAGLFFVSFTRWESRPPEGAVILPLDT